MSYMRSPSPVGSRLKNLALLVLPLVAHMAFPAPVRQPFLAPCSPLQARPYMVKYGLKGYRYVDEPDDAKGTNQMSFLLYSPRTGRKPLPMVVYLPGRGERGDLSRQFRACTIFDRVASEAFQRRHPCHLLAISPPLSARTLWGGMPGHPSLLQRRLHGLVNAAIALCAKPPVDTNRLYLTGFSYGGNGVYGLALNYPGVFAAAVPIAALPPLPEYLSKEHPGNWWHFHNEGDYRDNGVDPAGAIWFRDSVVGAGGDFRIGTYPVDQHNAWTAAWREDEVWDWVFSKSIQGGAVSSATGTGRFRKGASVAFVGSVCTASIPGKDAGHGPERVVDGLERTWYEASRPAVRGDWWQVAFGSPVAGDFRIFAGKGSSRSWSGDFVVEVSADGRRWTRAGRFSGKAEVCMFSQTVPARALRVRSENQKPQTFILRRLVVIPK